MGRMGSEKSPLQNLKPETENKLKKKKNNNAAAKTKLKKNK